MESRSRMEGARRVFIAGLAGAWMLLGVGSMDGAAQEPMYVPGERDYLPGPLREKVEALKASVDTTPRGREEVEARAKTLWSWSNAFAMAGGHVHENIPFVVGQVVQGGQYIFFSRQLPMLIRDVDYKERMPKALGRVTLDPRGPFPSGSHQKIEQTFTVGSVDLEEGGHIFLGREVVTDYGFYQTTDATKENYVTISSSRPGAVFVEANSALFGPKGQFVVPTSVQAFRLEGGTLTEGDTVTIVYGDTSGGSPGFRVPEFESDVLYLPLYIDFKGDEHYLSPVLQSYATEGGPAADVAVFAPTVVAAGTPFSITVRTQDRYHNRATGAIPGYDIAVAEQSLRSVPAGGPALQQIDGVQIEAPGVYRIAAESGDGALQAQSNPILVKASPEHGIYWGDTHAHIRYGEGLGSIPHFFTHARYDSRLDYVSLTEHDVFLDDFEWSTMVDATQEYNAPGEFITYLGYEWTAGLPSGGHHNVLFRQLDNQDRVPIQEAPTLEALFEGLRREKRAQDVVTIPHAHAPGNWKLSDATLERVVEITSMHGSFEWFGENYVKQGHEVGFVGASDDHRARPGVTGTTPGGLEQFGGLGAVLAASKTRDAIFAGLRARATYATTGERIALELRANGKIMGARLPVRSEVHLRGAVYGTAPIETIEIIKNGDTVWQKNFAATRLTPQCAALVTFESEADPMTYDVPRGARTWEGTIDVRGATLNGLDALGIDNVYNEFAVMSDTKDGRVTFSCRTRGRPNSLLLHLTGASEDTEIVVSLEETQEGIRLLTNTGLRTFPAETIRLPFAKLNNGRMAHDASVDAFTDTLRVTILDPDASRDRDLNYTGAGAAEGDYYYVRVQQIDGAVAWSSPWWVGAPRNHVAQTSSNSIRRSTP